MFGFDHLEPDTSFIIQLKENVIHNTNSTSPQLRCPKTHLREEPAGEALVPSARPSCPAISSNSSSTRSSILSSTRIHILLLALLFGLLVTACQVHSGVEVDIPPPGPTTTFVPFPEVPFDEPIDNQEFPPTILDGEFPIQFQTPNGPFFIADRPQSIISLSPTSTEILFAIGAGPQVIAVDDQSNFPPEAPRSDLSGIIPNVEAILAMGPDLVVINYDPQDLRASLESVAVPVLFHETPIDTARGFQQISELGWVTGNSLSAEELILNLRQEMDDLQLWASDILSTRNPSDPITFYHELDEDLFSVTSETFLGNIYADLGLLNVADGVDPGSGGYPQLSAEYILEQDPDLIFLADTICCGQNYETVSARPGWSTLSAVMNENIIELDDDIASRWGPRVVEFMRIVTAAISGYTSFG